MLTNFNLPPQLTRLALGLALLIGLLAGTRTPMAAQAVSPGYVTAWGDNFYGQINVPNGLSDVIALDSGGSHSLALKSNGTVVAWGYNSNGESNVPASLSGVSAVTAGTSHSLALKSNGTVVAWGCGGGNNFGQCGVPASLSGVTAIAAGGTHSLALTSNGVITAWGCSSSSNYGQCAVPAGLSGVSAIAAGLSHSLALQSNGAVVAWGCSGGKDFGQCSVPSGLSDVSAIAAGDTHSLALQSNGSVVAWGCSGAANRGQCAVPSGLTGVSAIVAGGSHSLALKSDGTVVAWGCGGANNQGQCSVPAGLGGVTAIAAGSGFSLAVNDPFPPTADPSQSPSASASGWTDSDVTVFWGWSDVGRGIDFSHCTTRSTSSGEGIQTLTATCQDKAGNVGTASYTVKVDKTGPAANPTQSPTANGAGWNNTNVTVNWNWTDPALDAGSSSGLDAAFCPTSSTSSGFGVQTLTAQCADQAGNVTSVSYTVKVDRVTPQIRAQVSPATNGYGWNNSAVTVSFTCQDQTPSSGLATNTVGGNVTLSNEGTNFSVTNMGTCVDNAGNVATPVTVSPINIDLTQPTISAAATTQPNANGWYNSDVTVRFTCADALSGIDRCPDDQVLNSEGTAVASTVQTSRDKGLTVSDPSNVVTVKIDKTAPVVAVTGVTDGAHYPFGSVPAAGCSTNDALSGVATQATVSVTGGNGDGTGTFTAICSGATDLAGNSAAPVSVSYSVTPQADSSAPVITPSVVGTVGSNGWYISDVTVGWRVVDNESAISSQSGCEAQNVTSDTSGVTFTCAASSAGGSNSQSVTIKRDQTAPVVTVTGVSNGATYTLGSVPTAGCTTTDTLSGVATQATLSTTGGNANGTGNFTVTCGGATDLAGNSAGAVSASYTVTNTVAYNWTGFFQPVDNLPTVNTVNAGQAIPVKFSLGGDYGLNIFASGYPTVQKVNCGSSGSDSTDEIEETTTAGASNLQYDPTTQTYTYAWKTDKAWAGTCRQLIVKLIDGSEHIALFQFTGKVRSADVDGAEPVQQLFLPLVHR